MANTVYEIVNIQLSNGEEVEVRPLTIKNLKKFTAVIKKLNEVDMQDETEALGVFVEAGLICINQFKPGMFESAEDFEEVIEIPTLMKILEIAGGLKMDPNFQAANSLVGTI